MSAMTKIAAQPMLGLSLPPFQTFADWNDLGKSLCLAGRNIHWLIGDWLIAGVEKFGDRARDEANVIFRSDVGRFDQILKTCRRFPEPKRHASLTFAHHLAVMAITDDDQAERVLTEAEQHRPTIAALKAQIKVLQNRQPSMIADDDPEDTAMRRIAQAWNNASREAREDFLELAQESSFGVIDL